MSKKKTTHGGKRARSGRKPREEPLVALTVRLKPDVSERLQTLKARLGVSHPALIEWLLGTSEALRVLERARLDAHPSSGGQGAARSEAIHKEAKS